MLVNGEYYKVGLGFDVYISKVPSIDVLQAGLVSPIAEFLLHVINFDVI